jgi:serine/threonine protein phosphatase PrpC
MKVHPHILTSSEILKAAEDSIGMEKMGTTIVLAKCFEDNSFVVCNVGDSRAYLWRANRQLKELTKDHSLARWYPK